MMSLRDFAVLAYIVVGLGLIAQGLRYLIASQFMHYHADVIQEGWSSLKPPEQRLMLGLLKGFGAGMLCVGVLLVFSAVIPLRRGLDMSHWFMAFISIAYTLMLHHVTRTALLPGAAPIAVTWAMSILCLAAAAASITAVYI